MGDIKMPRRGVLAGAAMLAVVGALAIASLQWRADSAQRTLSTADEKALAEAVTAMDAWENDLATLRRLRPVLDDLYLRYPESVPVLIESARLDLLRSNYASERPPERQGAAEGKLFWALRIAPRDLRANVLMGRVQTQVGRPHVARDNLTLADDLVDEDAWRDISWGDLLVHEGYEEQAIARYIRAAWGGAGEPRAIATAICHAMSNPSGPRELGKRTPPLAIALKERGKDGAFVLDVAHHVLRSPCADYRAVNFAVDLLSFGKSMGGPLADYYESIAETKMRLDLPTIDADRLHTNRSPELAKMAFELFGKALETDPDNALALGFSAELLFDNHDHEDAEQIVADAEKRGITHPKIRYERARLLQQAGKHAEAAKVYGEVETEHADAQVAEDARRLWPWALVAAGEMDAAETVFLDNAENYPDEARMHYDLVRFLIAERGKRVAAYEWGLAHPQMQRNGYGRNTWAMALYARWAELQGSDADPSEAAALFEEARALYPDARGMLDDLGVSRAIVERALGLPVSKPEQTVLQGT